MKIETTGFTDRLDVGYDMRSQGWVQGLGLWGLSKRKDGAASNCNKEGFRRSRFGVEEDHSSALAELSLGSPLDLHGKVQREQLDTQVWL